MKGNPICNSSVMIKKNILLNVNLINESDKMRATEDYNTWIKISKLTNKIYFLNKNLGFYQYNLGSVSKKNMSYPTLNAMKEFLKYLTTKEVKIAKSRILYMDAKYNLSNKNYKCCKKKLKYRLNMEVILLKLSHYFI